MGTTPNTEQAADRTTNRKTIWVFTPSRTDPKDLEFILVQRHKLLEDAVERVKESALTAHKHHLLFVGPRGCGKTHLVTLLVSRLSEDTELTDRLRIAWLNEDETCTTLLEFLMKIHAALEKRYAAEFSSERLSPVYDMKQDDALDFASKHLLNALGSRMLLVVTENLDAIFEGLGDKGQKQLRSFIQEHPMLSIVATAQRLVEDLSNRASPFFGFFQTEHLKPLNVEQATELLQNIARLDGKSDVVDFLATSRGRSRVRAIHHLSGGNHRIYIVLSQFITRDTVDALLEPFMKMVDELTPYYQERIRWLPPLQRKIVEYLCICEGTVPVKEIAKRLFATAQTISSQLQDLREKGYVTANQRGRESLYEISEPLMRICVEVKDNQRHQPLRLLVDFLRVWYEDHELKNRLGQIALASPASEYLQSAIQRNRVEGNLRKHILLSDFQASLPENISKIERGQLVADAEQLPEAGVLALQHWAQGKNTEAQQCVQELLSATADLVSKVLLMRQICRALLGRGITHVKAGETKLAIADLTAVIDLPGAPVEQIARALLGRSLSHGEAGDAKLAIADYTAVIDLPGAPVEQVAMALFGRGLTHSQAGEAQLAIADYTAVIELPGAPVEQVAMALFGRSLTHGQAGETQLASADYTAVIELPGVPVELVANALNHRGITHGRKDDLQRAIADFTAAAELLDAPIEQVAEALINRGITHGKAGDTQRKIADYTAVVEMPGAPVELVAKALFNRGNAHGQAGDVQREIADYTAVIELPGVPVELVANALNHRGNAHGQAGDVQREIADYTAVIELPGVPVELVAKAIINRGITHRQSGDEQRAIADYTAVIELRGAPADIVARALEMRGLIQSKNKLMQEAKLDFESLVQLPSTPSEKVVDAQLALCYLHFSEGRWSEGFQSLEAGLAYGEKARPVYYGTATDLIGVVFAAGLSFERRRDKVTDLLRIYEEHQALAVLGEAVVQHIGDVFRTGEPFPSTDNLESWALAWEQAAESVPDFRLSVRLLRTGMDYVKAGGKDPGILLTLTAPERAILEQALGLGV